MSALVGIDEQSRVVVVDDVGDAAGTSADDGASAAERLEHDPRSALRPRREEEEPGVVERLHDVRCLQAEIPVDAAREVADERPGDLAMAAVADHPERRIRDPRCREPPGVGDDMDVLVSLETRGTRRTGARAAARRGARRTR